MTAQAGELRVERGVARVLHAYEVGQFIDLDQAERRVTALTERATIKHKRRAPKYFEYQPAPLHVIEAGEPIALGPYRTAEQVNAVLFDFGAISVSYELPLRGGLADLVAVSAALYDDALLLADARSRVADLLAVIGPAVSRPRIVEVPESYAIFLLQELTGPPVSQEVLLAHAPLLAQILRRARTAVGAGSARCDRVPHRLR